MSGDPHAAAVLGAGVAAVVGGVLLLLQALGTPVPWAVALPGLLVLVGLLTAGTGVVAAFRHRSRPPAT